MNKNHTNQLDKLFAEAKEVPLLPSEGRIHTIINTGNGTSGRRLHAPNSRFTTTRGITMTLTALGLAGLLGIGTLYFSPTEQPTLSEQLGPQGHTPAIVNRPAMPDAAVLPNGATPNAAVPPATLHSIPPMLASGAASRHALPDTAHPTTEQQRKHQELAHKFVEEFGAVLSNFWLGKVNGYKQQIDAMLSPEDRAQLDRLRVRWSVSDGGLKGMVGADVGDHMLKFNIGLASNHSKNQPDEASEEEERMEKKMMEGMDPTMMLPFIRQMVLLDTSQSGQALGGAIRLSDRYRPGLDALGERALRDFSEFLDLMANHATAFIEQHKGELSSEDQKKVEGIQSGIAEGIGEIRKQEKLLKGVYAAILEPIIMLYNGSDINGLLSSTISEPVAGLKLQENQTLKQSIPNPATGSVAITYTLTQPSQKTTLRVFDAAGNVVATANQGTRPAGDHTINLDVSNWSNGTYLYHLTTHTESGERVFSKVMQVAK